MLHLTDEVLLWTTYAWGYSASWHSCIFAVTILSLKVLLYTKLYFIVNVLSCSILSIIIYNKSPAFISCYIFESKTTSKSYFEIFFYKKEKYSVKFAHTIERTMNFCCFTYCNEMQRHSIRSPIQYKYLHINTFVKLNWILVLIEMCLSGCYFKICIKI